MLLVCDNCVFVKKHDEIKELMKYSETGLPYKGAKEHYILDIEDKLLCERVIDTLNTTLTDKKK